MPKRKVGDIKIYYEFHGNGEPLVLIRGLGGSAAMWFRQIPELAKCYRVIALDNRGSGRSDKPDIPYTIEMMAGDVMGLLDAIGIEKAHIYGFAMGGMIAQSFALSYPDRMLGLVLACTSCGGERAIMPNTEALAALYDIKRRAQSSPEEISRKEIPFCFTKDFIDNNPEIIKQYISLEVKHWTPFHSYMRQLEAVMTHDTYARLHKITSPALVIAAALDRAQPLANSVILAAKIPNAELAIIQKAGHDITVERVQETNRTIINFLRRHPTSVS